MLCPHPSVTTPQSPRRPLQQRCSRPSPGSLRRAGGLGLALLLAAAPALAAPAQTTPAGQSGRGKASDLIAPTTPATQETGGPAAAQVHRLTAQLNALGAVSCLARAEQVARFLDQSNAGAVAVMPLGPYPNQRLVAANVVIPQANGKEALALISLAPNQANDCGATYQLMSTEPGSCTAALKARQAEPQGAIPLGGRTVKIQKLSQDAVFLGWQLGDTCLMIKQQAVVN